jgi:hypothetical protein
MAAKEKRLLLQYSRLEEALLVTLKQPLYLPLLSSPPPPQCVSTLPISHKWGEGKEAWYLPPSLHPPSPPELYPTQRRSWDGTSLTHTHSPHHISSGKWLTVTLPGDFIHYSSLSCFNFLQGKSLALFLQTSTLLITVTPPLRRPQPLLWNSNISLLRQSLLTPPPCHTPLKQCCQLAKIMGRKTQKWWPPKNISGRKNLLQNCCPFSKKWPKSGWTF